MADRLTIRPVARADGAELRLAGELTLATVDLLESELAEAERPRPALLVLDLRDVRFVDSTGLAAFVAAHKRNRRLIVVVGPGTVARLLDLTGLARELEVTRTGAPSAR